MTTPSSRSEAAEIGARYFHTGRPCRQGHVADRYTKGGNCVACARAAQVKIRGHEVTSKHERRAWREVATGQTYIPAAPCKHGHLLRWVGTNNCVECDRIGRERHKLAKQFSRIKKEYGLSPQDYQDMVDNSGSCCFICDTHEPDSFRLHIDHCHDGGYVRGLLCQRCNQGLGLFRDDPKLLAAAAGYLS